MHNTIHTVTTQSVLCISNQSHECIVFILIHENDLFWYWHVFNDSSKIDQNVEDEVMDPPHWLKIDARTFYTIWWPSINLKLDSALEIIGYSNYLTRLADDGFNPELNGSEIALFTYPAVIEAAVQRKWHIFHTYIHTYRIHDTASGTSTETVMYLTSKSFHVVNAVIPLRGAWALFFF